MTDVIATVLIATIIIGYAARVFYKEYKNVSQGNCHCSGGCGCGGKKDQCK